MLAGARTPDGEPAASKDGRSKLRSPAAPASDTNNASDSGGGVHSPVSSPDTDSNSEPVCRTKHASDAATHAGRLTADRGPQAAAATTATATPATAAPAAPLLPLSPPAASAPAAASPAAPAASPAPLPPPGSYYEYAGERVLVPQWPEQGVRDPKLIAIPLAEIIRCVLLSERPEGKPAMGMK